MIYDPSCQKEKDMERRDMERMNVNAKVMSQLQDRNGRIEQMEKQSAFYQMKKSLKKERQNKN